MLLRGLSLYLLWLYAIISPWNDKFYYAENNRLLSQSPAEALIRNSLEPAGPILKNDTIIPGDNARVYSQKESWAACPPNIDFEFGNFQNWQTNTGDTYISWGNENVMDLPSNTWKSNAGTPDRQMLQDRLQNPGARDYYGGFSIHPPSGNRYSVKLGSDGDDILNFPGPNALAEAVRYKIVVPEDPDYSITFSYAVVLENPNVPGNFHSDAEQPRFLSRLYKANGETIECATFTCVASGPLPGFATSSKEKYHDYYLNRAAVRYKDWSSVYVNLGKYAGQTLYLEFSTGDCTKGGHFGYAYVDVAECGIAAKAVANCESKTNTLTGPPGFQTYQWFTNNFSTPVGSSEKLTIPADPLQSTTYQLIVKPYSNTACPDCDCSDTLVVNSPALKMPVADAGPDKLICPGSMNYIGSAAKEGLTYSWTPADFLSSASIPNPSTNTPVPINYVLKVTNEMGCSATDTLKVDVKRPIDITATGGRICPGEAVTLSVSGASIYTWIPAAGLKNTLIQNPTVNPTITTSYQVIGYDDIKCFSDTAVAVVTVLPKPSIILGPDQVLEKGSVFRLTSTVTNGPIIKWSWSPATHLSCTSCPLPTATIKKDISYTALVVNSYGCAALNTINIKTICGESQVFVPNAFTPDGDGLNDILMVRSAGLDMINSFRVFNRWGEVVFEKINFPPNNPQYGWDGKIKGVVGPPDVFVYTVEITCEGNEKKFYKGNVSILK